MQIVIHITTTEETAQKVKEGLEKAFRQFDGLELIIGERIPYQYQIVIHTNNPTISTQLLNDMGVYAQGYSDGLDAKFSI